jgi:CSLREA domain-containing protein
MKTSARALLCFGLLANPLAATTVTVNDGGDSTNSCATTGAGTCTLRDAITYANTNSGSTIAFDISGAGVQTINPASAYPQITATVTIDGFTQPGSSPNTNGPGLADNSVHLIEIDGTNTGGGLFAAVIVFRFGGIGGSVVRGLVINRCPSGAITILEAAGPVVVEGNFLGTDPTGMVAHGSGAYGILIDGGSTNVTIGGTAPAARNVISANGIAGIAFGNDGDGGGSGHTVQGNFIGTNAAGTGALPGNQTGISMAYNISNSLIGGTTPSARNVISGNPHGGVGLSSGIGSAGVTANVIEGNFIGTDVTGTVPLGNGSYGVALAGLSNTIGGSAAGAGNVIAANADEGISIDAGNGSVIEGNWIGTTRAGRFPSAIRGPASESPPAI